MALRPVKDDERADRPPSTIAAASSKAERDLLVALRHRLASEIDKGPPAHALKGIVSELRDLDRSIRASDQRAANGDSVLAFTPDEPWDQSAI